MVAVEGVSLCKFESQQRTTDLVRGEDREEHNEHHAPSDRWLVIPIFSIISHIFLSPAPTLVPLPRSPLHTRAIQH